MFKSRLLSIFGFLVFFVSSLFSYPSVVTSKSIGTSIQGVAYYNNKLYVGHSTLGVKIYDNTLTQVGSITSASGVTLTNASKVVVDSYGWLYVSDNFANKVFVFDADSLAHKGTLSGVSFTDVAATSTHFFIANGQTVTSYLKSSLASVGSTASLGSTVYSLAIDNTYLYILYGGTVVKYPLSTPTMTASTISIKTGFASNSNNQVEVAGSYLYVSHTTSLDVIKLSDNSSDIYTYDATKTINSFAISSDEKYLFIAGTSGATRVINIEDKATPTFEYIADIPLSTKDKYIALDGSNFLYFISTNADTISISDVFNKKLNAPNITNVNKCALPVMMSWGDLEFEESYYVYLGGVLLSPTGIAQDTDSYSLGSLSAGTYTVGILAENTEGNSSQSIQTFTIGEGSINVVPDPSYDFGSNVAAVNETKSFYISNVGSQNLDIDSVSISGDSAFTLTNVSCTGSPKALACGSSACEVTVTYTRPAVAVNTTHSATLSIVSDNGTTTSTKSISISGETTVVTYPTISLNKTSISFNTVISGTPVTEEFNISNTGSANLEFNITEIDSSNKFSVPSIVCTSGSSLPANLQGGVIPPNGECKLTVEYDCSSATGSPHSGRFDIDSNDNDLAVNLNGITTLTPTSVLEIEYDTVQYLNGGSISVPFGAVLYADSAVVKGSFTVKNSGPQSISNLVVNTPADASYTITPNSCTTNLNASGGSCSFSISYDPSSGSTHNTSFTVTGGGQTITLNLTGTSASSYLAAMQVKNDVDTTYSSANPTSYDFGTHYTGDTVKRTVTIQNAGTTNSEINISSIVSSDGKFTYSNINCNSARLDDSESCSFDITVDTTSAFDYSSAPKSVTIDYNATGIGNNQTFTINFTAKVETPTPKLEVEYLGTTYYNTQSTSNDFGSVLYSDAAKKTTNFKVRNTGSANITNLSLTGLATPFAVVDSTCTSATLSAPAGECVFAISYDPTSGTSHSDILTVSGGSQSVDVNVTGTAAATTLAAIQVKDNVGNTYTSTSTSSSPTYNFGTVYINTPSVKRTITIQNIGTGLSYVSVHNPVSSADAKFSYTNIDCNASQLAQNGVCTFDINLDTSSVFDYSSSAKKVTISYTGTGLSGVKTFDIYFKAKVAKYQPQLAITTDINSSMGVDFGAGVKSVVTTKTLTFTNTVADSDNLTFSVTKSGSSQFAKTSCMSGGVGVTSLSSGSSCTITLTYTRPSNPSVDINHSGALAVTSNSASNANPSITLAGQTLASGVSTSSATLDTSGGLTFSGDYRGSTSVAQNVTLTKSGSSTINITNVSISGGNSGNFAVTQGTCAALPINGFTGSCNLDVKALAGVGDTIQTYNSTLLITYTVDGNPVSTSIPLKLVIPDLFSFSLAISFGKYTKVGETVCKKFTVINGGTQGISDLALTFTTNTDSVFELSTDSNCSGGSASGLTNITVGANGGTRDLYAKFSPTQNKQYNYAISYSYNPSGAGPSGTTWGGTPAGYKTALLPLSDYTKYIMFVGFLLIGSYFVRRRVA